jgi:hypothetical protein
MIAGYVIIITDDLAPIIYALGERVADRRNVWNLEPGVDAIAVEECESQIAVIIVSNDLTPVVYTRRCGGDSSRNAYGGVEAVAIEEAVVEVGPDDLPSVVDVEWLGKAAPRNVYGSEGAIAIEKAAITDVITDDLASVVDALDRVNADIIECGGVDAVAIEEAAALVRGS